MILPCMVRSSLTFQAILGFKQKNPTILSLSKTIKRPRPKWWDAPLQVLLQISNRIKSDSPPAKNLSVVYQHPRTRKNSQRNCQRMLQHSAIRRTLSQEEKNTWYAAQELVKRCAAYQYSYARIDHLTRGMDSSRNGTRNELHRWTLTVTELSDRDVVQPKILRYNNNEDKNDK